MMNIKIEPPKKLEIGTTLYLYTIRTGKFTVHKGKVVECKRGWYRKVEFETRQAKDWCPNVEAVGVVLTGGPKLWLTERDDAKAAKMFLEHEEAKLFELEKQVAKKRSLIKMLKSVGMEG